MVRSGMPLLLVCWMAGAAWGAQAPKPAAPKPAAPKPVARAEAGMRIWDRFADFWRRNGGAETLGQPVSPAFADNGRVYQHFERAVLVFVPENPEPHRVQLQRLGWLARAREYRCTGPFDREAPAPGVRFFEPTRHALAQEFQAYWERTGGAALYGLPLSRAFAERTPEGKDRLVQYFEKLKLERADSGEVRVAPLGAEELARLGGVNALGPKVAAVAKTVIPPAAKAAYPRQGHAPDYSWVAGTVSGGCPENPKMKRPCTQPFIDLGVQPPNPPAAPSQNFVREDGTEVAVPSLSPPLTQIPVRAQECVESSAWRLRLVMDGDAPLPKPGSTIVARGQLRWEDGQFVYAVSSLLDARTGRALPAQGR
jgi:hypothetical protein